MLAEVAKQENLEVTEEELNAEFAKIAEQYQMEVEKVKELIPNEEIKRGHDGTKRLAS